MHWTLIVLIVVATLALVVPLIGALAHKTSGRAYLAKQLARHGVERERVSR